jgi:hypothetical protein
VQKPSLGVFFARIRQKQHQESISTPKEPAMMAATEVAATETTPTE